MEPKHFKNVYVCKESTALMLEAFKQYIQIMILK